MSRTVVDIFYNIFWQNQSCQRLFMLSRNELLDTKTIEFEGNRSYFSLPRIIISNAIDGAEDRKDVLKYRSETHKIEKKALIDDTLDFYEPILIDFLESSIGKSINKLLVDFEENKMAFILGLAMRILGSDNPEMELFTIAQEYGFIPKHLKSVDELAVFFSKEGVTKHYKHFVNEENYRKVDKALRSLKDLYLNLSFQGLNQSSQILVSSLYDTDNYQSRIKLFSILYDNQIIVDSGEECFVECTNCSPDTYRGTLHLKINPNKLSKLKCIHCNDPLTYYMPYQLNNEIFELVKAKDGLILDVFQKLCQEYNADFKVNINVLNDVELDGLIQYENVAYIVEMKMYETSIGRKKIDSKIRQHVGKLVKDLTRMRQEEDYHGAELSPILLINILDDAWLAEIEKEIHSKSNDEVTKGCRIMNINSLRDFLSVQIMIK